MSTKPFNLQSSTPVDSPDSRAPLPPLNTRSQRHIASLSFDLDNRWTYQKVHGDPGWEEFPSYLDLLIPRVLEFLATRGLHTTFFVVGQDAALEKNHAALASISAAGHEIGNHSFSHEPWLHLYSREKIHREIELAESHIFAVTGARPIGFRGPGYSFSHDVLEELQDRGYLYDASTFPTFLGPLARFYYFMHANLSREKRASRSLLFGSFWEGLRPLKPYRWRGSDGLLEIPVTTMPIFRMPIHLSYILFLSCYSPKVALAYLRIALTLCRLGGIAPSLLLHPLDFLGADDNIGLEFFPAMHLPAAQKVRIVSESLRLYCDEFEVMNMREHALRIAKAPKISVVPLRTRSLLPLDHNP